MNQSNNNFITSLQEELESLNLINHSLNPKSLTEYDVIGFDIDHTLSIYNNANMIYALYDSFSRYLIINKGYPLSISYEANKDFIISLSSNSILLDLPNGKALFLDGNNKILKAYHGTLQLTEKEITSFYPDHCYSDFSYSIHYKEGKYFFSKNNFEFHIIPLFLLCVHYFDNKKLPSSVVSYLTVFADIFEALLFNFKLNDTHAECKDSGYFFPMLVKEPKRYFYTEYNARGMLMKLREKGKALFFATNSYFSFADFVMKNTLGDDYLDLFDIGFYYSKKPTFFVKDSTEACCMFYDKTPISSITEEVFERIRKGDKSLIGGSHRIVEEYFTRALSKETPKCLFVGDDLFSDCCAPSKLNGWDSVYIFDNLQTGYIGSVLPEFRSGWAIDVDNNQKAKEKKDVKTDLLKKYPKLVLSNVEGITHFL